MDQGSSCSVSVAQASQKIGQPGIHALYAPPPPLNPLNRGSHLHLRTWYYEHKDLCLIFVPLSLASLAE